MESVQKTSKTPTISEVEPALEHFTDPYVIQLIEALSVQQDEIERLQTINGHQFEDCADQVREIERLTAEGALKDEQIESLQAKVHLCAGYDALVAENKALKSALKLKGAYKALAKE